MTGALDFLPYDIDIEQALLAAILRDQSALAEAAAELEPSDFYDPLHARIFDKMLVLDELERPISPLTLQSIMKNDPGIVELQKLADKEGTDGYLETLKLAARSKRSEVPEYCRIISSLRLRRDAGGALVDAEAHLHRGDSLDTALAPILRVSDDLIHREQARKGGVGLGDAFEELARDAEAAASGAKLIGCPTGTKKTDALLGGYYDENLIIIAGRPGMGKSILGTSALLAASRVLDANGERVYDPTGFSLEMSARENAARMIADLDLDDALARGLRPLHFSNILKGKLDNDQWERFILLGQTLRDFGIDIYDEGKMTMRKIAGLARAKAARSKRKPLIVIDHIQIVGAGERYQGKRLDELTQITGDAKGLAKRLKCPVIALSQLSRGVESREDKRPNLGDLRESGSIEQDADVVLMAYRPAYYLRAKLKHARATGNSKAVLDLETQLEADANVLELAAEKNRNGAVGEARLWINVAASAVRDEEPETRPDIQKGFNL